MEFVFVRVFALRKEGTTESSKIKKNNLPSQKLAEKIGGKYIGTKSLLPENFPIEMTDFAEKEFPDLFYLEYHFMK